MTLLVVVAHPDDETFGCGSVLLHAAERTRTVVICATRGEAGENAGGGDLPPGGLGQVREAELRSAATVLGVAEVELLDYRDSGMAGKPPAGSLCAAPLVGLVDQVRDGIVRHRPSVVLTLDGSDGHRDHLRVRDAVLAAVDPEVAVYLACLPRSLMQQWVRYRAGDADTDAYAQFPDLGTPDEEVTTVIDTGRHYPARLQAIAEHRSQASPFADLPEDLRLRFLATEHLRRVQPPWLGGPMEADLVGLAEPGGPEVAELLARQPQR